MITNKSVAQNYREETTLPPPHRHNRGQIAMTAEPHRENTGPTRATTQPDYNIPPPHPRHKKIHSTYSKHKPKFQLFTSTSKITKTTVKQAKREPYNILQFTSTYKKCTINTPTNTSRKTYNTKYAKRKSRGPPRQIRNILKCCPNKRGTTTVALFPQTKPNQNQSINSTY